MNQRKENFSGVEFVVNVRSDDRLRTEPSSDIADQPMESVVGRLLKAHEEECRRISREIHDDLGGRITEIALLVQQLKKSAGLSQIIVSKLDQLQDKAVETAKVIGKLSHRLHPPVLEFTGITVALQSVCREFQANTGIQIEFSGSAQLTNIPDDITLCLYRMAQEALSNIAKHSGAKTAKVELTGTPDVVQLTIRDFGQGFSSRSKRKRGLGLLSMEERVRLLQGNLQIQTKRGAGTEVNVTLPLNRRKPHQTPTSKRAAGRG